MQYDVVTGVLGQGTIVVEDAWQMIERVARQLRAQCRSLWIPDRPEHITVAVTPLDREAPLTPDRISDMAHEA